MTRQVDERLCGIWIPDPSQAQAERWASIEISPAGWLRFIVRSLSGPGLVEHEYRVPSPGRLSVLEADGRWTHQRYSVEDGPILILGARRYVTAADANDRPWPADAVRPPD
jgi:hypothetical protein